MEGQGLTLEDMKYLVHHSTEGMKMKKKKRKDSPLSKVVNKFKIHLDPGIMVLIYLSYKQLIAVSHLQATNTSPIC